MNSASVTEIFLVLSLTSLWKQGVALTGRKTTGPPPRAAPGELRCICERYRRRRQTPIIGFSGTFFTRIILGLEKLPYCNRLNELKLWSVEDRSK